MYMWLVIEPISLLYAKLVMWHATVGDEMMSVGLDAMLVCTPGTCGGRMRIDGTRITVHRIATLYKQGLGAEEIAGTYPHLSLGQVYTALAYYHANQEQIDLELAAQDKEYDRLKQQNPTSGT